MDTDDTDALERLKRLAQQADNVKVSPPAKSSGKPRKSYAINYPPRAAKYTQNNTNRNAVLVFAAGLALVMWLLINSVHDQLPSNTKAAHHWTNVTAHFHKYPHADAEHDPQAYLAAGTGRKEAPKEPQKQQQQQVASAPVDSAPVANQMPTEKRQQQQQPRVYQAPAPFAPKQQQQPQVQQVQQQPKPKPQVYQAPAPAPSAPKQQPQQQPPQPQQPQVQQQKAPQQAPVARGSAPVDKLKGGAPCSSGVDCGVHGGCIEGRCMCAVTFTGPNCERPIQIPAALQAEAGVMSNWTAGFEGEMVLNKRKMATRSSLTVHLPGKEDDPDHGFRELIGGGSELSQLNAMLPADDTILKGAFFKKCAVIGSSGIVLNYEHGPEIDENEMVFRFNSAPTKGFEKYVGAKTTHRITNTQNWGFHEGPDENILIHFRAKSAIKGLFWNQKQRKKLAVYAFDPEFVEYMAFSLDFMATSGLYGIILAMHRCAEVNLYGFQVSTAHGALYHYYDVCDVPANVGRDDSEYNVVRAFAKAGLVNFREPCIIECHNSPEECTQCKEDSGFVVKPLPSDKKCAPGRVSRGHLEVPWRRDRHRHGGHGHSRL